MDEQISGLSVGGRIRHYRERAGLSRPVLGGLVGRSAEWVKAVETGRLLQPRLPLQIRLAEVLEVADLADLTGEVRLSAATWTKAGHEALPPVTAALAGYTLRDGEAPSAGELEVQVRQAWTLWHGEPSRPTAAPVPPWANPVVWFLAQLAGLPRGLEFGAVLDPDSREPSAASLAGPDGSWAHVGLADHVVTEGGSASLWEPIERAYRLWIDTHRPDWERLGLTVDTDGRNTVWIDEPGGEHTWPLQVDLAR